SHVPGDEPSESDDSLVTTQVASAANSNREGESEVERILKLVEVGELSAVDAGELLRALDRE
ncbi:MAG: SHOCT-like domain-containing protein, partial [Dehalococcoidia bacterium]